MATILLKYPPSSVLASSGVVVTGAADAAAALDLSDTSYITIDAATDFVDLAIPNFSADIPANARVRSVYLSLRVRKETINQNIDITIGDSTFDNPNTATGWKIGPTAYGVSSTSFNPLNTAQYPLATGYTASSPAEFTPTILDGLTVRIAKTPANNAGVSISSLIVAVTYVLEPVATPTAPPAIGADVNPLINWTYVGNGETQSAYNVRVYTKAVYETAGFTTADTVTYPPVVNTGRVSSSAASVRLNTNLTVGADYYALVKTYKMIGAPSVLEYEGPWSNGLAFKVDRIPIVDVTEPTGALSLTNKPWVRWTYSDSDLDAQGGYEIRIFQEPGGGWGTFAGPEVSAVVGQGGLVWRTPTSGFDPPNYFVSGANIEHKVDASLPNTGNFRAYVRVREARFQLNPPGFIITGYYLESAWDFIDFSTAIIAPPAPLLAVTEDRPNARNALLVTTQGNLLDKQSSSFEGTASPTQGKWVNRGGANDTSMTRQLLFGKHGSAYLELKKITAAGGIFVDWPVRNENPLPVPSAAFEVAPGQTYSWSGWLAAGSTGRAAQAHANFYNAAGALLSSVASGVVIDSPGWNAQMTMTFTTPANTKYMTVSIFVADCALDEIHGVDALGLWASPTVPATYVEGYDLASMRLQRRRPGEDWATIIDPIDPGVGATLTFYDNTAPFYKPVDYRIQEYTTESGDEIAGDWREVLGTTLDVPVIWLKDPENFANRIHLPVQEGYITVRPSRSRTVHQPLGRRLPLVVRGNAGGETFTFTYLCQGLTQFEDLMEFLNMNKRLLIQTSKNQWYADVIDIRVDEHLWDELRGEPEGGVWKVTLSFVEVEGISVSSV